MQDGSVITDRIPGAEGWRGSKQLAKANQAVARDDRFVALVERQARFVFRVAYALLRNSHDAEDAVQETFLKLYRTGAWESIEDEKAFLARTTWRIAVERLPRRRQEPPDPNAASPDASPEEAAIAADWNATVQRFVDALPEELRQPLALSTVEELNSRQIAGLMGLPEGTVRTRLMRARQILREKLTRMSEGRHEK
ncbi:MAG: sigma-70 family RNA polymerase sigma factor [Acidobacteriia bacterium]|nr:sigma-70 family RNA polymerase sigma factor [Terriglobia bacterium]